MSKKWVQAENEKDEKLDVWVLVEVPETTGTLQITESPKEVQLLGPDGKPLTKPKRQMGFQKP
jgi:hypothetical protein